MLALAATYWDDSWHTDKGRDEFTIPPHLLLYGGVVMASLAVVLWALQAQRNSSTGRLRRLAGDPAMLLAGLGGLTTLASAPLDNAWHEAYGRDAVLWSPPHLLAVGGSLALSVGVLAGLRATAGRGATVARWSAAAGVIGGLQVFVLEYDTDVPQFSSFWYLPVVALGVCLAVVLLDDLLPDRWDPLRAATLYTAIRVAIPALLTVMGFSRPAVPPLLVLFVLAGALRSRPTWVRLIAVGASSPLVWWPAVQAQLEATTVPLRQLPGAVILGAVAGATVALLHGPWPARSSVRGLGARSIVALVVVAAVAAGMPGRAEAHDPGQGETVVEGRLTVKRVRGRADLTLSLPRSCLDFVPVRTVARREGLTRSAPLRVSKGSRNGRCVMRGAVVGLTSGRWFVYAELRGRQGSRLEAWVPVAENSEASSSRPLYKPPAPSPQGSRNAGGAVLLLLVAGLLVACVRLSKLAASGRSVGTSLS